MVWALENPDRGMVEPDDLDYRRVLDIADPYLGDIVGQYSGWMPLKDRDGCSRRTWISRIPGSSRIFASFDMDIG